MYQPYPGGTQMPEITRPSVPESVRNAVKIMYVGAATSIIGIAIELATLGATKSAIEKRSPNLSASQVNSAQHTLIAAFIVGGLVGAALWVFIARSSLGGKNWARTTGTVFFAIATADAIGGLAVPTAAMTKVWGAVIWLVGLAAVLFLWRRDSTAFFKGATQP
jgi:hypothetical protein